jgi:hypothetical protein
VQYQAECPLNGDVILGAVEAHPLSTCPEITLDENIVRIAPLPLESASQEAHASVRTVHGVKLEFIGTGPEYVVDVPKYGIRIVATGADAAQILHSVRALKTIGYGRIELSIPTTWSTLYQPFCPQSRTIMLGTGPAVTHDCPAYNDSPLKGIVWVLPMLLNSSSQDVHASVKEVNGLRVYEPLTTDPEFHTTVDIPAFGIRIMGVGQNSAQVLRSVKTLTG